MNSYQIKLIENKESFNNVYNKLYEQSIILKNPDIHLIGLDCEYIDGSNFPDSFSKAKNWVKQLDKIAVCKLQIAAGNLCLVIDLCKFNGELPDQLVHILTAESWVKCGIGISGDMMNISYNFMLGQCNGVYEMKLLAQLAGIDTPNLEHVYSTLYNTDYQKVKRYTLSDWSQDMTMDMVKYAAEDAYVSYLIGSKFFQIMKGVANNTFSGLKVVKPSCEISLDVIEKENKIGELQEYCQKNKLNLPVYTTIKSHEPNYTFCINCKMGEINVQGYGNNKQDAKKMAAYKMLKRILVKE
jgi:hypothetical protein